MTVLRVSVDFGCRLWTAEKFCSLCELSQCKTLRFFGNSRFPQKTVFSRELPPPHTHRTSCGFLWKFVSCGKTSFHCWSWSRDFAAEPRKLFRKKTGGLRSGSAGSPGVGERSGTERSNERERRADIATARGARARFLPARRNFLSSERW